MSLLCETLGQCISRLPQHLTHPQSQTFQTPELLRGRAVEILICACMAPERSRVLGWHLLCLSHVVLAHLFFTWIWISSESSSARPCSCPALGSRALTTTLSPVRPFTRPCTVMAKLYCDGSRSDAWDRHQICFQGEPWGPRTPKRAEPVRSPRLFSKAAAFLPWSGPASPKVCRLSHTRTSTAHPMLFHYVLM